MSETPSRAVALFGTEEKVTPRNVLRAGPLTCELDGGNLRYIKVGGREALRAVAFMVRDRNWGTYNPALEDLKVGHGPHSFEVSYDAICKDAGQELRYAAKITGGADGTLRFEATLRPVGDFTTNRTGFVVLHAIDGVAGQPVEVLHSDGRCVQARFPELIDPMCPFEDIRALTHEVLPGVKVTCTMEGDDFEMEDHRNWTDASYKTYIRPLAKPWPYTLEGGATSAQSVTLRLSGQAPAVAAGAAAAPVRITLGGAAGVMPQIGLSLRPEHAHLTLQATDLVAKLGPQFLVCPFDSRIADGYDGPAVTGRSTFPFDRRVAERGRVMADYQAIGAATGAELVLEAVIACRDLAGAPSADPTIMRRDMAAVRAAAAAAGIRFAKVAVSPACDLKSTPPGSVWPACPPLEEVYAAAREAFPEAAIGGGMFSCFTELNRKRPPAAALDFVVHTTCPIVHAPDDTSVMETLEALPHVIRSACSFIGDTPYRVGPSTIGARDNPYGASVAPNPDNGRVALVAVDPRQRGLFAAAWYLGYAAHMARGGVEAVCLGAPVGELGVIYAPADYPQPWFDEHSAAVYPAYHVLRGLAAGAGRPQLATAISNGSAVQAVAWHADGEVVVWLANLTGAAQTVALEGLAGGHARIARLDESSFVRATADADALAALASDGPADELELAPYAALRLQIAA
jgi:D-apionolactonase